MSFIYFLFHVFFNFIQNSFAVIILRFGNNNIGSCAEFKAVFFRFFSSKYSIRFESNADISIGGRGWHIFVFDDKFVSAKFQTGWSGPRWRWNDSVFNFFATIFVNDCFDCWRSCCCIIRHMHFHYTWIKERKKKSFFSLKLLLILIKISMKLYDSSLQVVKRWRTSILASALPIACTFLTFKKLKVAK